MLNRNRAEYCFPCPADHGGNTHYVDVPGGPSASEGYEEITGLCGNEKYAHPEWMFSYDNEIAADEAAGTIPTFNKDIIKGGKAFCRTAYQVSIDWSECGAGNTKKKNNTCKDTQKRDASGKLDPKGKYTYRSVCKWDKHAVDEKGTPRPPV